MHHDNWEVGLAQSPQFLHKPITWLVQICPIVEVEQEDGRLELVARSRLGSADHRWGQGRQLQLRDARLQLSRDFVRARVVLAHVHDHSLQQRQPSPRDLSGNDEGQLEGAGIWLKGEQHLLSQHLHADLLEILPSTSTEAGITRPTRMPTPAVIAANLDPVPWDDDTTVEDVLEVRRAFLVLNKLESGASSHRVMHKSDGLALLDGASCLAKTVP